MCEGGRYALNALLRARYFVACVPSAPDRDIQKKISLALVFFVVFKSAQINVRFLIKSCVGTDAREGQVCVERLFSVF